MSLRRYSDPCGIARALDRVGERWALLVVRELLHGPKRFADLLRGLDGISANVLAQRLRELEAAGVVDHELLGPPASTQVYVLTSWGRELEAVLLALAAWGSRAPLPSPAAMSADAFAVSLRTTYHPPSRPRRDLTVDLALGPDRFALAAGGSSLTVTRGRHGDADLDLASDVGTMRALIYGRGDVDAAIRSGQLTVGGSRADLRCLLSWFARPTVHPDAARSLEPAPSGGRDHTRRSP